MSISPDLPDISEFMPIPFANRDLLLPGDHLLISFPRSGRNWLATMIAAAILKNAGKMPESPTEFEALRKDMLPQLDGDIIFPARHFWRENGRPQVIWSHSWQGVEFPGPSVYLLRRPEDCLNSYFRFAVMNGFVEESEDSFSEFVKGNLTWWILHLREALARYRNQGAAQESWLLVTYETMHQHPTATLAKIFDQFGIECSSASIDFAVKLSSADFVRRSLPATNPVSVAKPGAGRMRLSKELLDLIDTEATSLYQEAVGIEAF